MRRVVPWGRGAEQVKWRRWMRPWWRGGGFMVLILCKVVLGCTYMMSIGLILLLSSCDGNNCRFRQSSRNVNCLNTEEVEPVGNANIKPTIHDASKSVEILF